MKIEKRLEKLEQANFPEAKRGRGYSMYELEFWLACAAKYEGREEAAPAYILDAWECIGNRGRLG
jgi:hypothetical protein